VSFWLNTFKPQSQPLWQKEIRSPIQGLLTGNTAQCKSLRVSRLSSSTPFQTQAICLLSIVEMRFSPCNSTAVTGTSLRLSALGLLAAVPSDFQGKTRLKMKGEHKKVTHDSLLCDKGPLTSRRRRAKKER
jgi:hypothetical protein